MSYTSVLCAIEFSILDGGRVVVVVVGSSTVGAWLYLLIEPKNNNNNNNSSVPCVCLLLGITVKINIKIYSFRIVRREKFCCIGSLINM